MEEVEGCVEGGAEEAGGGDQVVAAVWVGVSSVEEGSCTDRFFYTTQIGAITEK